MGMWMHSFPIVLCLFFSCTEITAKYRYTPSKIDVRSPLYLRLPDCRDHRAFKRIHKKTSARGVVCSSFKNERGFLSEFAV